MASFRVAALRSAKVKDRSHDRTLKAKFAVYWIDYPVDKLLAIQSRVT
jgi:hypothetical protein